MCFNGCCKLHLLTSFQQSLYMYIMPQNYWHAVWCSLGDDYWGSLYVWETTYILGIGMFIMWINRNMECKNWKYGIELQYLKADKTLKIVKFTCVINPVYCVHSCLSVGLHIHLINHAFITHVRTHQWQCE